MAPRGTRTITSHEYAGLEGAYDWFNQRLFAGTLPPCLITLQRKARSRGYFATDRFGHRRETQVVMDELALNPDTFQDRSDKDILSTLVHEMCHCWQRHCGTPSRTGYHNKEWAQTMVRVGLMPSDTGEPGGKETGQRVSHYILAGGPFDQAADALLATGFRLNWQSLALERQESKARSKTKFTCPSCGQNAWARPDASLVCGECEEPMEGQQ
jgi:predicted SprT family Zn-dependent metalloprotease